MNREKVIEKIKFEEPFISIIVLNWNREYLLRTTVLSLIATTNFPFELFIVDNASTDRSRQWISLLAARYDFVKQIFLEKNMGGEAINIAFDQCSGDYILVSENDFEYLPDWDINMLIPFYIFPDLGQLSPCSPNPQVEIGEIWTTKPYKTRNSGNIKNYVASDNVGTSCLIRRELITRGIRWKNLISSDGNLKFPADAEFSKDVKNLGYTVAWSEKYNVINWGHIPSTWDSNPDYFLKNWAAKSEYRIDGLDKRLMFNSAISDKDEEIKRLKIEIGRLAQELYNIRNNLRPKVKYFILNIFIDASRHFFSRIMPRRLKAFLKKRIYEKK